MCVVLALLLLCSIVDMYPHISIVVTVWLSKHSELSLPDVRWISDMFS